MKLLVPAAEPAVADPTGFWKDRLIRRLVALAFILRVVYNLLLHQDGHPPVTYVIDEREYFGAAHILAEGRGFSYFDTALWVRPPLYVVALAGIVKVAEIGHGALLPSQLTYLLALLFQSILSALTLLPLGWLAYRLGGRGAARWAVLLGLLYLPLTLFAGLLLSETLFVFLFAWSLVVLVKARDHLLTGWNGKTMRWVALAGVLLGLCVLTRATALAFVPLAALWLALKTKDERRRTNLHPPTIGHSSSVLSPQSSVLSPQSFAAALLLIGVCVLTLLPWTVRNYIAYKRFVLVDTTSGYNLWLGSVGVRDEARLQKDLLAIPNPADKQSYAYGKAWEEITADPLKFVGKGVKESFDLWRPSFSAEERQVQGYSLGRIPAWHLVSLLLFDDLLYVVILTVAALGLALSPPNSLKGLTGLWAALWALMAFVFFAVTRFRLPVVAALIPWAGLGLSLLSPRRTLLARMRELTRYKQAASGVAVLAIALIVAPAIPFGDTFLGIERWGQQEPYRQAEKLLQNGNYNDAIQQYQRANLDVSDTRYGLAVAYLQLNLNQFALNTLRNDEPEDRFEPDIIRGEVARKLGNLEAARSFFNTRVVQINSEAALNWAWEHLRPAPVDNVDVGSGLDVGYVRGFHAPETDKDGRKFRWSSEYAEVRNVYTLSNLDITWSGWRPQASASASTELLSLAHDSILGFSRLTLEKLDLWTIYSVKSDQVANSPVNPFPSTLRITVNGFVGSGSDPRLLGLRVSSVALGK